MAYVRNMAKMLTSTQGTGSVLLGIPDATFISFADAGVSNGDIVTYVIDGPAGREIGRGTYNSTGPTLSRTRVLTSTNTNQLVDLIGESRVAITAAEQDLSLIYSVNNFRLSALTNNSATTTDVASSTSIFLTPHNGNAIGLYDGFAWGVYQTEQITLSLAGLLANKNYDIFAFAVGRSVNIEAVAWTNNTVRAVAIVNQNGILVHTTNRTRRYVGTIRTTSVVGKTKDTNLDRFVYNEYNKIHRPLSLPFGAVTHTYAGAYRPYNNSQTNRVSFVIGSANAYVFARVSDFVLLSGTSARAALALSLDSITAANTGAYNFADVGLATNLNENLMAEWMGYPGIGFHYLQVLQYASIAVSWYGSIVNSRNGIRGFIIN